MKTLGCIVLSCVFLHCSGRLLYCQEPASAPSKGSAPAAPAAKEEPGSRVEGAPAVVSELPSTAPAGRPSIGLVLEGGGALGLAHIGVLKWLEENHIPVDRIAGTSMGALIGGIYASGRTAAEVEQLATSSDFNQIFTLETPYTDLSYRRRQDRRELPLGIQLGLRNGLSIRNALLTDRGLDRYLHKNLARYNTRDLDYNRLPIPFRCVSTDLNNLQTVVFAGGPMNVSIRASISIPGIFAPVEYRKDYLVDGSIVDNLPTDIARNDLRSEIVIAVHLPDTEFAGKDVDSVVGVFARAYAAGTARNVRLSLKLANVLVVPATEKYSTTDYDKAEELIALGYQAAEHHRQELLHYALSDADWAAYLADRNSRKSPPPGLLRTLRVEGGSPGARAEVERDMAPLRDKPIDQEKIFTALGSVQGNGSYNAGFESFLPDQEQQPESVQAPGPDTGVLVRLSQRRSGPPFLIAGADLSAMNSNVTRTTFDLRFINQDLGGYGSELRADLRLGFLTQASMEYYRLLSANGTFLQPHVGVLRMPVYLWSNQVRTAEVFEQQAGGGVDFGRTFSRHLQLSTEWWDQSVRWHRVLGQDFEPDFSGASQTAVVHLVYDNTESNTISPNGVHLDLSGGALYNSVGSRNAPLFQVGFAKTITVAEKNILGFSANGNTYWRRNVADPFRFTLGGPLSLSASSIDEYRGTDDYLARAGYLRRLAPLPFGLGQGLYLTVDYEAGEIWAPERPAFLRQDILGGFVAATPLGMITFGGSIGDAGRRKVFFTLGRPF
ncbi:MAG TPA: patatin-like phospholipase family protein [Acidobacteriaceae bacterium]|nr:patatin-like phospholipase family protein [Acidobacteriaceae bacterium]